MTAARKNLLVDLGTTFDLTFEYRFDGTPIDLTGHTIRFLVQKPGDKNTTYYYAEIPGSTGPVTITVDEYLTGAWQWSKGAYTVDLIEPDGDIRGLLWGTLTVRDRSDV